MFRLLLASAGLVLFSTALSAQNPAWSGYAGDPQHTAVSAVASQPLQAVRWSTPVDLNPQYSSGNLYAHYGSPAITAANTVVIPVKTGTADGFKVEGRSGATGALLWTQTTDYTLPPHGWLPSYAPAIAPGNTLYYPGAGGTVYKRGNLDVAGAVTPTQLAFYGLETYTANQAAFNANVKINTPITADAGGNIYFGYHVADPAAVGGLQSGFARITPAGAATSVSAASLAPAGDTTVNSIAQNCASAVTADGSKVYVTVTTATGNTDSQTGNGYLVALNTSNFSVAGRVDLRDVKTPTSRATVHNYSTAAPMIGPNGDVYYGVLETPFGSTYRGWMLHFDSTLNTSKPAGAFGWDATASIVPKSMVPSYTGTAPYLIMTKYNNYAGPGGGDGVNKIAILDPYDTFVDPRTNATVMKEILTIAGPTHDNVTGYPNAVREWCINTAVVDPATHSILVNNEDGKIYRWDTTTNTLSEVVTLTAGLGEAYTPTLIGPDGTVYAINDAILFAVGYPVPEPTTVLGLAAAAAAVAAGVRRLRRRATSTP